MNKNWVDLDVSANQITGTLQYKGKPISAVIDATTNETKATTTSFVAKTNRISGTIDGNALNAFDRVEVLAGNIIQCGSFSDLYYSGGLPSKDPAAKNYVCGSEDLDFFIILYFIFFVIAVSLLLW